MNRGKNDERELIIECGQMGEVNVGCGEVG